MENEDYVDFNKIREYINISDVSLFKSYLKEIYKDLSDRTESSKKKGITKIIFFDYIKLPVFIAEKLFIALDIDTDGYLNSKEFVDGLINLYVGQFEDTVESVFHILDFDKDGFVTQGDVKILLSYLPLKTDKTKVEFKFQMESLNEIDDIVEATFGQKASLSLDEFTQVVESRKSDVYLQILCFLYQKKPFNEQNISMLKLYRKRASEDPKDVKFMSPQLKRLPSPNRKSTLSPALSFLQLNQSPEKDFTAGLKRKISFLDNNTPQVSGFKGMVRLPNEIVPQNESSDVNDIIKNSKNIYNSPSRFLKKPKQPSEFNLASNLVQMEEFSLNEDTSEVKEVNSIIHEDWIYKLSESSKIKSFFLVLIGKDIYYYRDDKKNELLGMHNLSGCYVKENGEQKINGEKYYAFLLQFAGKTRNYYCKNKECALNWTSQLKKAIGYLNFFDFYEMLDDLGEGKFGQVKLGMHKRTMERVAIKIIKKESMKPTDVELVKSEIDIMKLCHHPNVVRLLDHFENAEYIFIVMEYLAGGDLGEYFKKKCFKFSEKRAAEVMYQIANGIKYLHQYGILHRDLKPENIMLTQCSDQGEIKIMDFGLSKIMGPQERVIDGFGTLSFVAPEVLVRMPYNKQIDIWSIGIILYYMLTGLLPFDDENDNEEKIAKMTVFMEVRFPSQFWSKRSQQVIDLISHCLIKDPEKRSTIDEFLNHEWIKTYVGNV